METIFCVLACNFFYLLYCCQPYEQETIIIEPHLPATSAVIFLHGAGQSGPLIRKKVENLIGNFSRLPSTRIIFPTARPVRISPLPWNNITVNMWFSFNKLSHDAILNIEEMDEAAEHVKQLVAEQVSLGIPHDRICLVGYSSGGIMAMHFGYEYVKNLACIGGISSYISANSGLYLKVISQSQVDMWEKRPPLYMYSGGLDVIVPAKWSGHTAEVFKSAGLSVTLEYTWTGTHFLNQHGVEGLFRFIHTNIYTRLLEQNETTVLPSCSAP